MAKPGINNTINLLCYNSATDGSSDLQHVLSAIGEADLTETLALQEAIMRSQMTAATASGVNDFFSTSTLACTCRVVEKQWNMHAAHIYI